MMSKVPAYDSNEILSIDPSSFDGQPHRCLLPLILFFARFNFMSSFGRTSAVRSLFSVPFGINLAARVANYLNTCYIDLSTSMTVS